MKQTRILKTKLTADERLLRGKRLAATEISKAEVLKEKKAAMADFKDQISAIDESIAILSNEIESGEGDKEVEIEIKKEPDLNAVVTYRLDTGDVVEQRPIDDFDRQQELPGA